MQRLPLQTIGDIGRHGLELHVYCPSCYSTRWPLGANLERWSDRCFATARFRCSGTRYNGAPCRGVGMPVIRPAELLPVGGPVTLAFLTCPRCIWEINQAQLDNRHGREPASAIDALAAVVALTGTYMGQRGDLGAVLLHLSRRRAWPILNSRCSSIDLALHRPPQGELPWRVELGLLRLRTEAAFLGAPTGGGRYEAAPCADGTAQRPALPQRLWRDVTRHVGAIGLVRASQQAEANARSMKKAARADAPSGLAGSGPLRFRRCLPVHALHSLQESFGGLWSRLIFTQPRRPDIALEDRRHARIVLLDLD